MKKLISELKSNPINPRKISADKKKRLQCSIMLFPKMLTYRDIIIDEEDVILAGNQRCSVLNDICGSNSLEWMDVLKENEKWLNMSDESKQSILNYWKNWQIHPEVEVSLFEGTEDEKKELILKDNNEFGEYDYEKLLDLFDESNLVNFGFDEELFYNPEEDDTVVVKRPGAKPKKIDILTFGKNAVSVTKREYEHLVDAYSAYTDEATVSFGFVRHLINNLRMRNGNS